MDSTTGRGQGRRDRRPWCRPLAAGHEEVNAARSEVPFERIRAVLVGPDRAAQAGDFDECPNNNNSGDKEADAADQPRSAQIIGVNATAADRSSKYDNPPDHD